MILVMGRAAVWPRKAALPHPVSGQPGPQQAGTWGHWDQSGWGPTEVNIKEGCIGAFHEDFFGGAVERLIHKIDAISDHGSDALSKALWGRQRRLQWGPSPSDGLTLPAHSFPKRGLPCKPVPGPGTTLSPVLSVRFELASSCSHGLNGGCPCPGFSCWSPDPLHLRT